MTMMTMTMNLFYDDASAAATIVFPPLILSIGLTLHCNKYFCTFSANTFALFSANTFAFPKKKCTPLCNTYYKREDAKPLKTYTVIHCNTTSTALHCHFSGGLNNQHLLQRRAFDPDLMCNNCSHV